MQAMPPRKKIAVGTRVEILDERSVCNSEVYAEELGVISDPGFRFGRNTVRNEDVGVVLGIIEADPTVGPGEFICAVRLDKDGYIHVVSRSAL